MNITLKALLGLIVLIFLSFLLSLIMLGFGILIGLVFLVVPWYWMLAGTIISMTMIILHLMKEDKDGPTTSTTS